MPPPQGMFGDAVSIETALTANKHADIALCEAAGLVGNSACILQCSVQVRPAGRHAKALLPSRGSEHSIDLRSMDASAPARLTNVGTGSTGSLAACWPRACTRLPGCVVSNEKLEPCLS